MHEQKGVYRRKDGRYQIDVYANKKSNYIYSTKDKEEAITIARFLRAITNFNNDEFGKNSCINPIEKTQLKELLLHKLRKKNILYYRQFL